MKITFPGGKRVAALLNGFEILTDQPRAGGGEGAAPAPFDFFLASLGTCAGIYVLGFLQARGLSAEGLEMTQAMEWDPETHLMKKVSFNIKIPPGVPEKYRDAIVKAAERCAVKRTLHSPPEFEITAG
ncbi:MAG TPA: osmotically inducible protein OsmC [Elusimicrobia bacterium]|nr:osmotically inducible protein OsmC [Elusimicrobiota bacterium]